MPLVLLPVLGGATTLSTVTGAQQKERRKMEALTVLLIGVTSTLGFIAFGMGVFVCGTDRRSRVECQRELTPSHRIRGTVMSTLKFVMRDFRCSWTILSWHHGPPLRRVRAVVL